MGKGGSTPPEASPSILFREPRWQPNSELRKPATKPGPTTRIRARGFAASMPFFIRPASAVLKRGEGGGGGFGIKDGIKQVGQKGKVLVRQRIIAGSIPPAQPFDIVRRFASIVATF